MELLLWLALQDKIWTRDLDSASYGSGAVADIDGDGKPEIIFGTYFGDSHLYALNAEDGSILWKMKDDGGPMDASVLCVDVNDDKIPEVIAADSAAMLLYCVNGKGEKLWTAKLPNCTDSPPSLGDGVLYAGTFKKSKEPGHVCEIDLKTGELKRTFDVPGHIQSTPALADLDGDKVLDIIVGTWQGDDALHAISGKTGKELWTFKVNGDMYHGPAIADLGDGLRLIAASHDGNLYVVKPDGSLDWSMEISKQEQLFAPVVVADKMIFVAGTSLRCIVDRKVQWAYECKGLIQRGVAVADLDGDKDLDVCFGSADRTFRALDAATGKELWTYDATIKGEEHEELDSAPLVADFDGDGALDVFFVGGRGGSDKPAKNYGRAFCLKAGKGTGPGWTTFHGNERRTGTR